MNFGWVVLFNNFFEPGKGSAPIIWFLNSCDFNHFFMLKFFNEIFILIKELKIIKNNLAKINDDFIRLELLYVSLMDLD